MYFCARLADCVLFQLFACSGTCFVGFRMCMCFRCVHFACSLGCMLVPACVCVRACMCVCPGHFLDFVQLNIRNFKT